MTKAEAYCWLILSLVCMMVAYLVHDRLIVALLGYLSGVAFCLGFSAWAVATWGRKDRTNTND